MKLDDKLYNEIFDDDKPKKKGFKKSADETVAGSGPIGDIPADAVVVRPNKSEVVNTVFDWLGSLFTALVCVLLLMTFVFRIIDVDGTSMEPTLIDTDKVVITDLFYTPSNGDVVVISHGEEYAKPLVKRVIAVAGQELKIDFENNAVYVDGEKLNEPYVQGVTIQGDKPVEDINGVIPEGKIFVMGDNRTVSLDSRYRSVDLIDESAVIGKAQFVVVPHTKNDGGKPTLDLGRLRYIYG